MKNENWYRKTMKCINVCSELNKKDLFGGRFNNMFN